MHDGMMEYYFNDKHKEWVRLAEKLLTKAHLPILIRARCHAMLSRLITSPFAVEHGERAVEILDVELRKLVVAEAFPESQVEEARELLALAKERSAAAKEKDKQAPPIAGPS